MTRQTIALLAVGLIIFSCKNEPKGKNFTVSGKIQHMKPGRVYLEEIPVATMQRFIVDSAMIGEDGKYSMKTRMREAAVYNLRRDIATYPLAWIINDAPNVEVNITFNNENDPFPAGYEIKGSDASNMM